LAAALLVPAGEVLAQFPFQRTGVNDPIVVAADAASHWRQGSYDVWWLRGNCSIDQGGTHARSREAVLWVLAQTLPEQPPTKVVAYLEGAVSIEYQQRDAAAGAGGPPSGLVTDKSWFGRFQSTALQMRLPHAAAEPRVKPAIFHRGVARFDPEWGRRARLAQYTAPSSLAVDPVPPGMRRIQVAPRSAVPVNVQWVPSPGGDEWMAVIPAGVNLVIDGLETYVEGIGIVDKIDVEADRLVVWTSGIQPDLNGQALQSASTPLEIYMEGNIVFRQGDRVIYARQMYYDVRASVAMILDAELLTPVPNFQGLARIKASVLRQLDRSRFIAHDALLTTSRMGDPRYYFFSKTISFQDVELPVIDPLTGMQQIDPVTLLPQNSHQQLATSQNNFLYVGGVPVFYWPTMATDLQKPNYYFDGFTIASDSIFGTQVRTDLDAYQLLGITNRPAGTEWDVSLDYLSDRGFGYGTYFGYDRPDFLGVSGPTRGMLDAWFIKDDGLDNLGLTRRALVPERTQRGRVFWNHRQQLPRNFTLTAELGWISDYNFLEQYYEREWDENKDQTTGLELKQTFDNQSWSIRATGQLNDFFTQTEWLPRLDHFFLGQSLFGDRLTWFEHSQASYARMRPAEPPTDPAQRALWTPLPWDAAVTGERLVTRQEVDYPFQLGPVKIVPYALGELAHWGEALDGQDLQRAYFQAGTRASLPFWSADPLVENQLLNVHGLAHKVVLDMELAFADANRNLDLLPLYDPIDDDNIEAFRRRIPFTTFGAPPGAYPPGASPPGRFDPRFYGVRTGLQSWVTSPSTEVAEDLTVLRMGMRQRWQTKRGQPGQRRIIDWITLDTNAVWFPQADRDNFGADFGLADYDFRWHLGDRLTLVSDGSADFFSDGLRTVSVGGLITRPPRGSAYLGLQSFTGPFSSNVLNASYNYWMSPKWVSTLASSIAFSGTGNVAHAFSVTRVGEALLVTLGFNVDQSTDNFGVSFVIEPRFLPSSRFAGASGVRIPPAGALGLE